MRRGRGWVLVVVVLAVAVGLGGCASRRPGGAREANPSRVSEPVEPSTGQTSNEEQRQAPPKPRSGKIPGTQRPYVVNGQTYVPLVTGDGYREQGIASWYGGYFHGRLTSCGEVYDMNSISAAHKLLPMHTWVRVTNLDNGRALDLRINDRGPFVAGRIIDLSYAAAIELGMANRGTARVVVETLGAVPGVKDGDIEGLFYVQVGSFQVKNNADNLASRIMSQGYPRSRVVEAEVGGQRYWRVQAGTFPGLNAARDAHARLLTEYPSAFILAD